MLRRMAVRHPELLEIMRESLHTYTKQRHFGTMQSLIEQVRPTLL